MRLYTGITIVIAQWSPYANVFNVQERLAHECHIAKNATFMIRNVSACVIFRLLFAVP